MAFGTAVSAPNSLEKDKKQRLKPEPKVELLVSGNWEKAGPSSGCLELNYSKFICKMSKD